MLCRICIHDSSSRKCLHLFVCNNGRTDSLDYRLGPRIGVYRSSNDRQHQLEPLSGCLSASIGIELPHALSACPWDGGIVNIPAMLIVVLMSLILMRGIAGSSLFNGFIVFLKIGVILVFVILGWRFIQAENYVPLYSREYR